MLRHEPTDLWIVRKAAELASNWDPSLIDRPQFVNLIELVAYASIAEQSQRREAQEAEAASARNGVHLESASGAVPSEAMTRPANSAPESWLRLVRPKIRVA